MPDGFIAGRRHHINDLEFDDGDRLGKPALAMAHAVARFKADAKACGIPYLYVNDNFGQWQSDFKRLVAHCLKPGIRGRRIAKLLKPDNDDYFVLKPRYSGFVGTPLELLLEYLQAKTLILCGLTTDCCVLFTANDAYLRHFRVFVPADCSAALTLRRHTSALTQMRNTIKADVRDSSRIDLPRLAT